jgi:GMP synthase-like glutamine amidotransferase
MRWHCLQHAAFEGPAQLSTWVHRKGYRLSRTRLWKDATFPAQDEFDGLFILGGPMNVYEDAKHSWLVPERAFIERTMGGGKPILGVCLGAQLIASVLGGRVTEMSNKEIGWFPVKLTQAGRDSCLFRGFPSCFTALHWHGDCFAVPSGAVHAARSDGCEQQAFIYGDRIVGLQFHLETSREGIAAMIQNCGNDLCCGPHIQDQYAIENCGDYLARAHQLLSTLLDNLSADFRANSSSFPSSDWQQLPA